ncbi:MAG: hypothetical protein LAP87_10670 [Acidobacteriia bacterium]|nr:hypothetical protein [Terriglobia bacterium]
MWARRRSDPLVELFLNLPFRQSIAHLQQELAPASVSQLLEQTVAFYQLQLQRYSEGARYLEQRGLHDPVIIEELGIGYAPGGNLRGHLATLGYSFEVLLDIGLINQQGRDAFCRSVIFTCRQYGQIVNLYGRSIGTAFPHRLLPRSKGGLVAWDAIGHSSPVILVEGLFDPAVLWQAGLPTASFAANALPANALYLEIVRLVYNLVTAFQRHCLDESWQYLTLQKLRYRLFLIPGELTRPQNRPVLRLRPSPMIESLAETILARAARLKPLQP